MLNVLQCSTHIDSETNVAHVRVAASGRVIVVYTTRSASHSTIVVLIAVGIVVVSPGSFKGSRGSSSNKRTMIIIAVVVSL